MTKQDPGCRIQTAGSRRYKKGLRCSLGLVSGEPQLSLCKMNISCIIRWSRMALQQETRATAFSSSSHLLALPPSVSYSSCFRLSICLFFFLCPLLSKVWMRVMPKCDKKKEKGQEREKNLYWVGKRTGEEGEGRMSAWGGPTETRTWGKEK